MTFVDVLLANAKKKARRLSTTSYVLVGFGVLLFVGSIMNLFDSSVAMDEVALQLLVTLGFIGGGIWANRVAVDRNRNIKRYEKYITLITRQGKTSLDSIVSATDISYFAVEEDLRKMILNGYFPGAYIDKEKREVVLAKKIDKSSAAQQAPTKEHVVVCGGCGADNRIPVGSIAECQYCRRSLE
ncbi:MAG: hypothetical protein FWD93_06140 [Coriobacteriia bacterium]|nr:hypothetical protein [Coriobacteriia bacterium]